jgi:Rieske Fe-S protein
VELGKNKYGVYRDEEDDLHIVSATCTHLHCIVQWNNDEKSWDCPCHGSRFTYKGKVINGPANQDLFYYREKAPAAQPH